MILKVEERRDRIESLRERAAMLESLVRDFMAYTDEYVAIPLDGLEGFLDKTERLRERIAELGIETEGGA